MVTECVGEGKESLVRFVNGFLHICPRKDILRYGEVNCAPLGASSSACCGGGYFNVVRAEKKNNNFSDVEIGKWVSSQVGEQHE